ncbi:MAG: response regulator [Kordia sp.]|uniref:response regulator n=1 Tax=Kordia sp. TaxID=1965332 RepID=UPI00385F0806
MKSLLLAIFSILLSFSAWSQKTNKKKLIDSIDKYKNIASKAREEYKFIETIEASKKAISYCYQSKDFHNLAFLYYSLGVSYDLMLEPEKAIENYDKGLEYAKQSGNYKVECWLYNNMANIYSGSYKKIDSGMYFYKKSLKAARKTKDSAEILMPILNIGWMYIDEKMYDSAYSYLVDSKNISYSKFGDTYGRADVNYLFGRYYLVKNKYKQADASFKEAIKLSKDIGSKGLSTLTNSYFYYAELASKEGKHKVTNDRLKQYINLKDSLANETKVRETQIALAKFSVDDYKGELKRKEAENRSQAIILKKTQQTSYALMIAGFVLLLLLITLFKNYKFRNSTLAKLRVKNIELREAKEETEKQSNLKAQFLSTVSHELRTPLYGVIGLTSLLSEDFPNLKESENFKSLRFSSSYLLTLINNVLQINKIDSEDINLLSIPFNLKKMIDEVVTPFSFAFNKNKNELHVEVDPRIPTVLLGDSVRLSQILINLIGNAMKFTESGNVWIKLVHIKQEQQQHIIQFNIKDDGMGIPKEKQSKIFDKFVQLGQNEKNYQGTGLGLPIVRQLLKLFESDITLKSEEGLGAEFTFEIKFEESGELPVDDRPVKVNEIDNTNKKLLIVDDNKINCIITKRILQVKGYQCDVAEDGYKALSLVKSNEYDLILMDINMPRIDGVETTMRIRETDKKTPIIALTAAEEDQIRDRIYNAGMNDYIIKPYDLAEFHQIILKNLHINII